MATPPKKADFSNVKSSVESTEKLKADFSNVQSTVTSTETIVKAPPAEPAAPRTVTVAKGDTLSAIAKRELGKASLWPKLFEANRDQLDNPDRIKPGQVLKIPDLGG
jgi:nucleoid-associated protein YgaU